MGMWRLSLVFPLSLAVMTIAHADTPSSNLDKKVGHFTLKDAAGKAVALSSFKGKKAVVVVFVGTECPISNLYMTRLPELAREYGPRGVQFLAINSNCQDTAKDVAEHGRKYPLPFPILKDERNLIADKFGARRTPEAFVLDSGFAIRYQGRIDDQFGVDYRRQKPTRRDLALALDEILAGKKVTRPTTPVAGCHIGRVKVMGKKGQVTYAQHVSRILQKNCQECHRPGQIGPMSLLTYQSAVNWADTIREVIVEERMPPWHADPRYGKFANDRRLSRADRGTLLAWIDQGMPKGDDRDMPPPRKFDSVWRIGKPDLILSMAKEFEVPAKMPRFGIPYKHFVVDPKFTEDKWVIRAEARPGAPEVVHHIVVFIVPPGQRFFPGNPNTPTLCGTAPGDMPTILPKGVAKKVPKGSKLIFQMHYTPNGRAQKDRSRIGLILAKKPPKLSVKAEPIYQLFFRIPAGADNYKVEAWYNIRQDSYIIAFMPHMHLRGKDFLYELISPDGKKEILLSVPRYNFNWQSVYRTEKPIRIPKGSRLHCVAHFDNSTKNPNNPDPTKIVTWGDQTWEEMMIGWTDFAVEVKP
jgi:peroxiredoxin/mono/diheme cytochrome c family protein